MKNSLFVAASLLLMAYSEPGQASPGGHRCMSAAYPDLDLGHLPGTGFDGGICAPHRLACGDPPPDSLAWLRLSRCEPPAAAPAKAATPGADVQTAGRPVRNRPRQDETRAPPSRQ